MMCGVRPLDAGGETAVTAVKGITSRGAQKKCPRLNLC
jgi:hypothetical protein